MRADKVLPGAQEELAFAKTITKDLSLGYLLFLPEGYGEGGKKWPLMMFLHGAGERGSDLNLVKKHGPPRLIAEGRSFPFIIVAPQCPLERTWEPWLLTVLLDQITAAHAVDEDRVYVTGLSMGGFGTWGLATHAPDRFAAIAPICGGGYPYLGFRLRRLPVWAFHGALDEVD